MAALLCSTEVMASPMKSACRSEAVSTSTGRFFAHWRSEKGKGIRTRSPGLHAIPDLVVFVIPYVVHRGILRLLQLFCDPVTEAVLDFDVFDEIQNFPRQGVWKFLDFLENLFSRRHIPPPPLDPQGHNQAFYYGLKSFQKQSMGSSQTTGLGKRYVLQFVWSNAHLRRNMVSHHTEPLSLFIGELLAATLLVSQPGIDIRIDPFRKGRQLIVLVTACGRFTQEKFCWRSS